MNRLPNGLRNLPRRWAGVPLDTSVADRLLDRGGHRVRPMETLHGNGIVVDVAHYELLDRNEAPGPIEAAIDGEADWGKGNPTDVAITKAPIHPGRTPHRVWNPHPTVVVGEIPPAIVKRRPTPLVIALEAPAVIGVDPVPAGEIRPKIDSDDRLVRPPNTAQTTDDDPLSVGRQRGIEDSDGHADRGLGNRSPRSHATTQENKRRKSAEPPSTRCFAVSHV